MATLNKPVGYECEFVDQAPDDYFCKLCKHVAREPTIASCCTEVLCKACIDAIVQDTKPCPSCEDVEIEIQGPHKKYTSKILALQIRCTMKDRGCPWTGQLQHLDAHLDVTTGDCEYVDVECPKKCVQKVQKRNVDTHLANECPNRDYRCLHCNFASTFCVVSKHFDVCRYYPLACPNRCGVTFERDDLDDHMKMCRLEEVECVFAKAGCSANFIRDNEDAHMDQNMQKHLALMPAATLKMLHEQEEKFEEKLLKQQEVFVRKLELKDEQIKLVEQKLQDKQEVFEKKLEEKDVQVKRVEQKLQEQQAFEQKLQDKQEVFEKKLKGKDEEIKRVEQKLQEQQAYEQNKLKEKDEQIKRVEQKLEKQGQEFEGQLGGQQIEFQKQLQQRDDQIKQNVKEKDEQIKTLQVKNEELQQQIERNFQQMLPMVNKIRSHKYAGKCVPPYDIQYSNYQKLKARGRLVDSPSMYTHPGGYSFRLKLWPNGYKGTHTSVSVHTLKSDHDAELKFPVKFTTTVQLLNQHRDQDHHTRDIQCQVTMEKIGELEYIGVDWTFIPFAALEWNRDKQTQYLKDECLKFRITKIIVH